MRKADKRALGEKKAQEALEESRRSGLEAQRKDRERRAAKAAKIAAEENAKKAGKVMARMGKAAKKASVAIGALPRIEDESSLEMECR